MNIPIVDRMKKHLWIQIVVGSLFLLQPILLPVQPNEIFFFAPGVWKNVLANFLIMAFFYFNYFYLIPRFYFRAKYVPYFLMVFLSLCAILLVSSTFTSQISPMGHEGPPPPFHEAHRHFPPPPPLHFEHATQNNSWITQFRFFFTQNDQIFFLFGAVVLFSLLLKVSKWYFQTENAKKEAEINYLLVQINPHFLFNTLNSIYALTVIENAPKSSESLLKLSGLMRYITTETHQSSVLLENEINCISDFIELQKLRLTSNVDLKYSVSGDYSERRIAPMLLIPFVENAFKHGVNAEENSAIDIQIKIEHNELEMVVCNNKVSVSNDTIGKSGLGIQNATDRLKLLYPNKHDLQITDSENQFCVVLKIEFTC